MRRRTGPWGAARPGSAVRRSPGQSLVEFALLMPILLVVTVGVVDFARIFSSYIALTDAARIAALYAADGTGYDKWCAYPPDDSIACPSGSSGHQSADPDNIAFQVLLAAPTLEASEVTLAAPSCDPSPCGPSSTVTVSVTYRVPILTPVLGALLGGEIPMSTATTAKVLP